MELVNTLIAVGVGASLGAFLSYVVGGKAGFSD